MDAILEKIRDFADKAHGEQQRKYTPERYIVHPVRVMEICRQYTDSLPVLAAALLHDVIEDTPVSEKDIAAFLKTILPENTALHTVQLVVELTDVYVKQAYPQWSRAKRKQEETLRLSGTSAEAQTIKYADILDNSREILQYDPHFGRRFLKECKAMLTLATRGNRELYKRTLNAIDTALKSI